MIVRVQSRAVCVDEFLFDGVRQATRDDDFHWDERVNVTDSQRV
jgi:hypothetical protein